MKDKPDNNQSTTNVLSTLSTSPSKFMLASQSFLDMQNANIILAFSKFLAVLPTQPIQVIMRNQQAALADNEKPQFLNAKNTTSKIFHEGGQKLSPFYRGTGPGLTKEFMKCFFYKGALLTKAPDAANTVLKTTQLDSILSPTPYHILQSTLAGIFSGIADVVCGGALESWATHSATSQGKNADKSYYKEVRQARFFDKVKRAYQGSGPSILKGSIGFTTYFAAGKPIKQLVCNQYNAKSPDDLSWDARLLIAMLKGGAVAITSSPFDIVKTQAQMPNPTNKSTLGALANNFKTYGIRGITAGLPLKFTMVTIGWTINDIAAQAANHYLISRDVFGMKKQEETFEPKRPEM